MIPIREAIETGAWLHAQFCARDEGEPEANNGDDVVFRIRVKEFEKVDLRLLDEPDNLSDGITLDSNIWRVGLDLVSICKCEIAAYVVRKRLVLIDGDGYEFRAVENERQLTYVGSFADSLGIKMFHLRAFPPKIRRYGSYVFELPDEFDDLFVRIRDGELREA